MVSTPLEYDKEQLDADVARIAEKYSEYVDFIRYKRDLDWAHVPSLYFQVQLKDRPGEELVPGVDPRLQPRFVLSQRISTDIEYAVRDSPLFPSVRFRTASEAKNYPDPRWNS